MTQDPKELVQQVRTNQNQRVRAAARLMTLVENEPERMPELLVGAGEWPSARMVIGLTGPPGCGKSMLVDRLLTEWRGRARDRRIGVIAVDASSPSTNGAFLGDRLRMMGHATDANVFIRSAATRRHTGGLMLGVSGFIRVLGLLGCDVVLIETVGVGQNETEITTVADLVVVALDPGHGDAIQLLKSGLMEVADVFVINKADREDAPQLHDELLSVLRLKTEKTDSRMPDICLVSALRNRGVADLVDLFEQRAAQNEHEWKLRRRYQLIGEVKEAVLEETKKRILDALRPERISTEYFERILQGDLTVAELVDDILPVVTGTVLHKVQHDA